MKTLMRLAKRLRRDDRGNAVMITALAVPTLIGSAGFAVDTAQWYLWKRELQHAVDQAAYAGAWARTKSRSEGTYVTRAQQEYNANLKVTRDFATAPSITLAAYNGGKDNSVIVIASATKSLPFSNFLTGRGATIRVKAQASYAQGAVYNACLVSTADTGTGTLITGNAKIDASCGLAALSCDPDDPAIKISGSASVITDSIAACGSVDNDGTVTNGETGTDRKEGDELVHEDLGEDALYDRYEDLSPPEDTTPRTYQCTGQGNRKQANLLAGTYSNIIVACTTVLQSGIYVINGGVLDLTANYNVTGRGVMFVLKNGAKLKLGGSGNNNILNLTPPTVADLTPRYMDASRAEDYADILIFEDRNNNPTGQNNHTINGNANSTIDGLIYFPASHLDILGTADISSQCLRITAYRITVQGDADVATLCPTDAKTVTGSAPDRVRLVR